MTAISLMSALLSLNSLFLSFQVVGGRITESGRLGAFITKVKKGSLADVVGHLRAGRPTCRVHHCLQVLTGQDLMIQTKVFESITNS